MSFFEVKQIKASRKVCRCYWCGEMIKVGDAKTTTATVFEGEFRASNFHPECYDALELWQELYTGEYEWPESGSMQRGSFNESITDMSRDTNSATIAGSVFALPN